MKLLNRQTVWKAALVGVAFAVTAFCCGCMPTTAARHVDAISQWHEGHTVALRLLLSAQSEAHVAAADAHIRGSLTTKTIDLANELHRVARAQLDACEHSAQSSPVVVNAKKCVGRLEAQLRNADADRMNRVGDAVESYRAIQRLRAAQECQWESVSSSRDKCAEKVRHRLKSALDNLAAKLDVVVVRATAWIRPMLQQRWEQCQSGVRLRVEDAAWAIAELEKCKAPAPGDCRPWHGPRTASWDKSPLYRCLTVLTDAPRWLDKAIGEGRKKLERFNQASKKHLRDGQGEVGKEPPCADVLAADACATSGDSARAAAKRSDGGD